MVSVLLQERTAGFLVGLVTGAAAYVHMHRELWRRTAETAETLSHHSLPPPPPPQEHEPLFGRERQVFSEQVQSRMVFKFVSRTASLAENRLARLAFEESKEMWAANEGGWYMRGL
ncbi:hypothetical protein KFL_004540020 [Klebsormidium nitens]|uniref:Uncharacterized protein n=1 Tax=Klebsormidium nitens TaxID=105231 RepID=A0A1Y1IJ90_KLENI|nr:hypothetical protein KFL_004540020 [Klebsormidium nitens]|eukprot:GAQ88717.1 hypothetical protein KFL_004540020 [Klebsormidium nitens]